MPVNSTHVQYDAYQSRWKRIEDSVDGARIIFAAGTLYLPKLPTMDDSSYDRYRMGAKWYGAPARTLSGLTGMVNRKPPRIEVDDAFAPWLNNVTLSGLSFDVFSSRAIREVIRLGRYGVMVDFSAPAGRPYLRGYEAPTIINWATETHEGITKLSLVVLGEQGSSPSDDEFTSNVVQQYRVLSLDTDGFYSVRLYQQELSGEFSLVDERVPRIRGNRLDYIPFVFLGPHDLEPAISASPIEGVVDLTYHHYLQSADYNWGLHFIALPTPWVTGVFPDKAPTSLGPTSIWVLPEGATAGMLEYTGKGLAESRESMETLKREMADMGARILESRSKSGEAARTVELKQASDAATIGGTVETANEGLTQALVIAHEFASRPSENVNVDLNQDFVPIGMEAQELTALVAALQAGALSRVEFFDKLQRGEVVDPSKTFDEHVTELEEDDAGGLAFEDGDDDEAAPPVVNQDETDGE